MHTNINKKNDIYFNFAKQLFSSYNILQINNELVNYFNNLSLNYNLCIPVHENVRTLYNEMINKYYHNEITIKSNFINNVLLKSNNHVTIFEFSLGTSRADLCKINNTSIAFEIKTDLDNFSRLEKQIKDYSEIFEEVYLICSKDNLPNLFYILPSYCGVYSYSISYDGNYKFKKEKTSISSNNLNSFKQLRLLTKKELVNYFSNLNYSDDKEIMLNTIINNYSNVYINTIFKRIIKEKYKDRWEFLKNNHSHIYEIDYQWFFKNNINPDLIYQ